MSPQLLSSPWFQAAAVLVVYGYFCWFFLRRPAQTPARGQHWDILIGYASQGGAARALAEQLSRSMAGRQQALLLPLNQISPEVLQQQKLALFVASTYGEGEPPDNGVKFANHWGRKKGPELADLSYAVLALGDRSYRRFCAFGHRLDQALKDNGAKALFPAVEVNCLAAGQLQAWRNHLAEVGLIDTDQLFELERDQLVSYAAQLSARRHVNSGSAGGPVHHLQLSLPTDSDTPLWQAGDIARITVPGSHTNSLPVERDYSIASIPDRGALELMVRLLIKDDGSQGLGSGYLSGGLAVGDSLSLKILPNASFHPQPQPVPLILIGNGTGLAGLRAHMQQQELVGCADNWLIFGERNVRCDRLLHDELRQWYEQGVLSRLDCVYSRDGDRLRYVQDVIADQAVAIEQWLGRGAAIYVCGSREGMAPAVHRALVDILGQEGMEALILAGRYRRDIY